jgi:two-component system, chemotaxis family, sensor kinase CheA
MNAILSSIILPRAISDFERRYLDRMNRIGLAFFALHLPVFMLIAFLNQTGALLACGLTLAVLSVPGLAYLSLDNPRLVSASYGFTAMLMGGLLVHFGQGPVQIEMHFYFFALLAMLALYGNPMVIIVAAVTVAAHHLLFWLVLPTSVFNYDAPIWVVAVHAGFVVLESVGTIFIARSFFDNVIGLERIVNERTRELDGRNRDLRLVLDNVQQGLVTIGLDGVMAKERSAAVDRWLGTAAEGTTLASQLHHACPDTGEHFEGAWEQVASGVLPAELALDQLPKRMAIGQQQLDLSYTPILAGEELRQVLVVLSDVTNDVARERLEAEQREAVSLFDRVMRDRAGFLEFFAESERQISAIVSGSVEDPVVLKRVIHTLKGNSSLFRVQTIADLCHAMETSLVEDGERPRRELCEELSRRWKSLSATVEALLGNRSHGTIELEHAERLSFVKAVRDNASREQILGMVESWQLEPTRRRLSRIAEQAEGMAVRLDQAELDVKIEHGDLRLDAPGWAPFWSAFVHVVRNAVDHGGQQPAERKAQGKPERSRLTLSTRVERGEFVVEIGDDGAGIDWDAIAKRAQQKGLPHGTRAELVEALFDDGITTKQVANEYSGRGIGMGAAREACRDRNGNVFVHSEPGLGTRIEFRFPKREMAPAPPAQMVA